MCWKSFLKVENDTMSYHLYIQWFDNGRTFPSILIFHQIWSPLMVVCEWGDDLELEMKKHFLKLLCSKTFLVLRSNVK